MTENPDRWSFSNNLMAFADLSFMKGWDIYSNNVEVDWWRDNWR